MSPYLAIADLNDGRSAIVAIDPTKRIGDGCSAIVQSLHQTRSEAEQMMPPATLQPKDKT